MKPVLAFLAVSLFAFCPTLFADVIYDSKGFENFAVGALNGQDGWNASGNNGGTEPMVVADPSHAQGTKAVRMDVPDNWSATSYMEMPVADLIAAGYDFITVTLDVYRQTDPWVSNLWWWWFDVGDPTYGIQWDQANGQYGETYPFGWYDVGLSAPNVLDKYATIYMEWDFTTGFANGYYDGNFVLTVPIQNIASLTGWANMLAHDEGTGSGADTCWIDNFKIEAFFAEPKPDVKINGQDGPLTFPHTQVVTMTLSLDPGMMQGDPMDLWVLARLNSSIIYSWVYPTGWQYGIKRAAMVPLFPINNFVLHNGTIPAGSWEFGFVVDAPDNILQLTYKDILLATST